VAPARCLIGLMSVNNWRGLGVVLLIAVTTLHGNKTVPSVVSASHLIKHGKQIQETRVHLFRDHKVFVEEITQQSTEAPKCKVFYALLSEPAFQRIKKLDSPNFRVERNEQETAEKQTEKEIWHIAFRWRTTRFFTFAVPQSSPPASFVSWFEGARRLPTLNIPVGMQSYQCTVFSEEMSEAWQR
jgi:hypothetical protein